ncbi:MAG: T9SS type A sorting domain-containing protein [Prevotellaceae bacterium]|jgi:hypothetical protein|nr:T9SS type A sorting domain-containing protein [Prevotellaceae bacterium]
MKKIVALSLAVAVAFSAAAQPSLTFAKHALRAGDVHQTQRVTDVEAGAAGANVMWDFSAAKVEGSIHTETLGSADNRIAVTGGGGTVFQFDVTPYGNDFYGYKTKSYSVVYENPILKTKYPFSFLDQHSGEYYGYIAQGSQKFVIDGTFSSEVDGYGTLKLPNGAVLDNVLRVKTTEVQQQYYCSMNTYTEVKYLWYAQDFRYPVFVCIQVSNEMKGKKSEGKTSYINVAALTAPAAPKVEEKVKLASLAEVKYSIYPNPVETETNIAYTLTEDAKVYVAVYSSSSVCLAKIVNGQQQSAGEYVYKFTPQVSGTYFVRFAFGDKVYVEQIVKK